MSVPSKGYSSNTSCVLHLISTFLLVHSGIREKKKGVMHIFEHVICMTAI
jgi:hypothetical protein